MSRGIAKLAIAFASIAMTSCSLEGFDVRPCLHQGKLAFELGKYSIWFGLTKAHPKPGHIWVGDRNTRAEHGGFEPMWEVYPDLNQRELRKRRGRIGYAVAPPGTTVSTSARPLKRGGEYRIGISDGGHNGLADFTFSETMPVC